MESRRGVLKLIVGGTVLAAASMGGCVALGGTSHAARAPWREAGQQSEYRRRALSYALLAPNPHNRQPWLVDLEGEDGLALYCDLGRRLPATDPFDRQITIGCGAFLELLKIAAAEEGYRADIEMFPDGEDPTTLDARPVARVRFVPRAEQRDPLFSHVLDRRSNKNVYQPRNVAPDALATIEAASRGFGVVPGVTGNTALAGKLRDLTWRAHQIEVMTPYTNQESVDLMRIGAREVSANPDGIELEGITMTLAKLTGMVSRDGLADQTSDAFKQGLKLYKAKAMSGRAFGWLATPGNSRAEQLNAGRAYVRVNLRAAALGLAIHPWSQALQEYPEMAGLYDEVHSLIGDGNRLQMLFRVGYADEVIPTPRRGLDAHLRA